MTAIVLGVLHLRRDASGLGYGHLVILSMSYLNQSLWFHMHLNDCIFPDIFYRYKSTSPRSAQPALGGLSCNSDIMYTLFEILPVRRM